MRDASNSETAMEMRDLRRRLAAVPPDVGVVQWSGDVTGRQVDVKTVLGGDVEMMSGDDVLMMSGDDVLMMSGDDGNGEVVMNNER